MKDETKLARWINNEMDAKELNEFQASAEFETYRKIKEYSAQLTVPELDMDALYNDIAAKRGRETKVRTLSPWYARIAAILVVALGITYYFYTTNTTMQMADAGQRKEFLLPDNSEVVLNAASDAEYRSWNWDGNRKVILNGEAFFKVAKGQKFDVVTPQGTVTVVGTQFNVRVRGNRLDVTCFEGKVKVTSQDETVLLTPGKSVAYENGKSIPVPAAVSNQPGWLTYQVAFHNENLENVLAELERQYGITIDATGLPKAKPYTGTLPTNDLETALKALQPLYHFKSLKSGNKIILSSE